MGNPNYYNPETGDAVKFGAERLESERGVPKEVVAEIKRALDNLENNYVITPKMINPNDLSITFGVLDVTKGLKYKVSIIQL